MHLKYCAECFLYKSRTEWVFAPVFISSGVKAFSKGIFNDDIIWNTSHVLTISYFFGVTAQVLIRYFVYLAN